MQDFILQILGNLLIWAAEAMAKSSKKLVFPMVLIRKHKSYYFDIHCGK